jgi:hypothetical protein
MKKILVIATGWHFSSQFYINMPTQQVPEGYKIDYFCVAHRPPEHQDTINEKEHLREEFPDSRLSAPHYDSKEYFDWKLRQLENIMYEFPITREQIEDSGWTFMEEPNTIGDMECFNQWTESYDYREYDFVLITHDDNFILSDELFVDIVQNNIITYKPILETRSGHRFQVEKVNLDDDWYFIDNGYAQHIPKAFEPRGSFSLYKKELIDMLPNNKFDMYQDGGLGKVTRVGETNSVGHQGISAWNTHAGTFREFLYNGNLVEKTRYFSLTKRVSKYCIEGERGFVSNALADGPTYLSDLNNKLQEVKWL